MTTSRRFLRQRWRFVAFALNIVVFYFAYVAATGHWYLTGSGETIWLIAAIGMWGVALLSAPFFRPPRDALASAAAVLLTLFTLDPGAAGNLPHVIVPARLTIIAYCALVIALAMIAAFLKKGGDNERARSTAFAIGSWMASGELLFGATAFISIFGYYRDPTTIALLVALWLGFALLKPIELLIEVGLRLGGFLSKKSPSTPVGTVHRVDHPNIVRVSLTSAVPWTTNNAYIAYLPGGRTTFVLPLFTQIQDNELIATGICAGDASGRVQSPEIGELYECDDADIQAHLMGELTGGDKNVEINGFVVEGSNIGAIRFEISRDEGLEEGTVVFCKLPVGRVYYQILGAETSEESFRQNPRGTHIVQAAQLGTLDTEGTFRKFAWLPPMNAPVFRDKNPLPPSTSPLKEGEFVIGEIPSTKMTLRAHLPELVEYHTAVLGVTGTGKTELALDIIREALRQDTKVFCVDLTGEYRARLADLGPKAMGLTRGETSQLDSLLFEVETGEFKAAKEKQALKTFIDQVRDRVQKHVADFLESDTENLGLFELAEVTNTRATLRTTELFLSEIMAWARNHRKQRRVLIVLEEAHTIIPETAGSGFDYDTQWVVGRIGQIALQGRKYGVGLMLISQRTALVSKTILSQCNTYFTHSLIDQTSLGYLANVYSADHVRVIPNLRFLEFIAYGKAVRSDRPMLSKRAFDIKKLEASKALDRQRNKPEPLTNPDPEVDATS